MVLYPLRLVHQVLEVKFFEQRYVLTRSSTVSSTSAGENQNNCFDASNWIIEASKLQALKDLLVLLFKLPLQEEEMYNQFSQHTLATIDSDLSSGFYERDNEPLRRGQTSRPELRQLFVSHSLRRRLCSMSYTQKMVENLGTRRMPWRSSANLLFALNGNWFHLYCSRLRAMWNWSSSFAQTS